jgi:hypothetical protein
MGAGIGAGISSNWPSLTGGVASLYAQLTRSPEKRKADAIEAESREAQLAAQSERTLDQMFRRPSKGLRMNGLSLGMTRDAVRSALHAQGMDVPTASGLNILDDTLGHGPQAGDLMLGVPAVEAPILKGREPIGAVGFGQDGKLRVFRFAATAFGAEGLNGDTFEYNITRNYIVDLSPDRPTSFKLGEPCMHSGQRVTGEFVRVNLCDKIVLVADHGIIQRPTFN